MVRVLLFLSILVRRARMPKGRKTYEVYEDDLITILRRTSNGRKDPAHLEITLGKTEESQHWPRTLKLTVDELYDLADVIDELCDDIADGYVFGEQNPQQSGS
jgi:hypothetical protein